MPNLIDSAFVKFGATPANPGGSDWDARAIANGATQYSDPIPNWLFDGTASLLSILTSADDITISYEVSDDKVNWYTPYDTSGTDLGAIKTNQTSSTWFALGFIVARWARFKVVANADSVVTLKLFKREMF